MMEYKIVYIDVNVLLDLICSRRDAKDRSDAVQVFSLIDKNKIIACTSAASIAMTKPFLRREQSEQQSKNTIKSILKFFEITTTNQKITDEALASDFLDWEDALHYYSALHYGVDCIITRNVKDFKHSKIPILTPEHFIQNYLNNL